MKVLAIFFATAIGLGVMARAMATTYSLEPSADARVIHLPGFENNNYAADILSVYTFSANQNTQQTFIQFDLSSITLTTNEQVTSATLTLIASTGFGTNAFKPMEVYRVLSPWTETGLTWSNRDATHAWTNAGGDYVGTGGQPYAVSTSSPANGQAVSWDVTRLVQEWITNGAPNYGLLLKSSDGSLLTFDQRETGTPGLRPHLTVVAGLPPLHASSSAGLVTLSWTGTGVLQEKTNLDPAISWTDSGRTVTPSNGTNSVTIPGPKGNNFFRLRGGP